MKSKTPLEEGRGKWKQRRNAHPAVSFISVKRRNCIPDSQRHLTATAATSQHQGEQCWYCTQGLEGLLQAHPKILERNRRINPASCFRERSPFLLGTASCSLTLWNYSLCLTLPSQFYKYKTLYIQFILEINVFLFHPQNVYMHSLKLWKLLLWPPNIPDAFSTFPLTQSQGWLHLRMRHWGQKCFMFQWQPLSKCQHWAVTVQVHSDAAPASAINLQTEFTLNKKTNHKTKATAKKRKQAECVVYFTTLRDNKSGS